MISFDMIMRHYITLVEALTATSLSGQSVPILQNPSPEVLLRRLQRTRGLRGIVLGNDVFWANSYSLIHVQISKAIGGSGYGDARLDLDYKDGQPRLTILPAQDETYQQIVAIPGVARLKASIDHLNPHWDDDMLSEERDPSMGQAYWIAPAGRVFAIGEEHPEWLRAYQSMVGLEDWQVSGDDANYYAIRQGWTRVVVYDDRTFLAAEDWPTAHRGFVALVRQKLASVDPGAWVMVDIYGDDPSQPDETASKDARRFLRQKLTEDLDHSQRLLFHATGRLAASLILATGVIEAKTDDKAYAATSGNGVSLTRSYEFALKHRGRQRDKIIFVLTGLDTRPVDYWANKASHRTEAEEWHAGAIDLRKHLVSINSPTLSLADFIGRVGEDMKGLDAEQERSLYRGQLPAVRAWQKRGYRQDAALWNRWQPVRGVRK